MREVFKAKITFSYFPTLSDKLKNNPSFFKSNFVIWKPKSLELSPMNTLYNWKKKKTTYVETLSHSIW